MVSDISDTISGLGPVATVLAVAGVLLALTLVLRLVFRTITAVFSAVLFVGLAVLVLHLVGVDVSGLVAPVRDALEPLIS